MEKIIVGTGNLNFTQIAEWITYTGELNLISGELGKELSESTLSKWFTTSVANIVGYNDRGDIIGIATLSTAEALFPKGIIEICHCIVHPEERRKYNGSCLIFGLIRYAKALGYEKVVGRVVKENTSGHELLKSLRWNSWQNFGDGENELQENVTWYQKNITHEFNERKSQFWTSNLGIQAISQSKVE